MSALLVIVLCSVLNRARGDDRWMREGFTETGAKHLPGRALWYVAPAIGLVALHTQPWPVAAAFAAGYLFWAVWGWGHILMRVGGTRPDCAPDVVESALLALPGSIVPLFTRMAFVLPGIVTVAWLTGWPEYWLAAPAFAAIATISYHVLFRPLQPLDWLRAEFFVGALWGVLIVGA